MRVTKKFAIDMIENKKNLLPNSIVHLKTNLLIELTATISDMLNTEKKVYKILLKYDIIKKIGFYVLTGTGYIAI